MLDFIQSTLQRHSSADTKGSSHHGNDSSGTSTESKQLKSFILLEFDRQYQTSHLLQVNRVKTSERSADAHVSKPKRSISVEASTLITASSLKSDIQMTHAVASRPMHRYLSFTVNVLIFVLWESLFYGNG